MRRTIMNYGPTVGRGAPPRLHGMSTVSVQRPSNQRGLIHRAGPGIAYSTTVKSKLSPKVVRGIRMPGYFTPNYPSPED